MDCIVYKLQFNINLNKLCVCVSLTKTYYTLSIDLYLRIIKYRKKKELDILPFKSKKGCCAITLMCDMCALFVILGLVNKYFKSIC